MAGEGIDSLSRQQLRCLEAVGRGLTTAEIAYEIGIAESTVNTHVETAVRKLSAKNRRHAAQILREVRPTEPPQNIPNEILRVDPSPHVSPSPSASRVAEERMAFVPFDQARVELDRGNTSKMGALQVLGTIVLIATAIMILLVAVDPLTRGASTLANTIQPFQQH